MKRDQDSAQVKIPPPLMLLGSILIGIGLHYFHPLPFVPESVRYSVGGGIMAFGIFVVLYCAGMFRKAQTAIEPWRTTSEIVTRGPYRWSRNPIYLSFVVAGSGTAILLNNFWIVTMQLPLILAITRLVIQKEERYLEEKFGDRYRAYKRQVRRWI